MTLQPVLIDGQWRASQADSSFQAANPTTGAVLPELYPVSAWSDCEAALTAACQAAATLRQLPVDSIADFLRAYADRIEQQRDELVELAHNETGLPRSPRLADVELPRTTNQLRQAASAAREQSWRMATIDTQAGIRSGYEAIGPVCVFGPNNFPFAFGSVSGGDFAAAIAAGNPVLGKANSSHPGTTRRFAELALQALESTGLPGGTVQLIYRLPHADGLRLVADPRIGATAYTGSRAAGLQLKLAADQAGKPIYLELSSVNPVILLPGALRERGEAIVDEFVTSGLMGTGQFCTNPGLLLLVSDPASERFLTAVADRYRQQPAGVLLSEGVQQQLLQGIRTLREAGAEILAGGETVSGGGYRCQNTLLRVSGDEFLKVPRALQTEAFGNCSLAVVARSVAQAGQVVEHFEGNLTGCIYSATDNSEEADYESLARPLRCRVGRLLNDKMPTGVAVSPAMNHGGPFPATGHPGFTAVGIPTSIHRFAALQCFDQVRPHRLPTWLRNKNPNGIMWRSVDGQWTRSDLPDR
jgi:NADP-dependent aldehyde dehydrogenase